MRSIKISLISKDTDFQISFRRSLGLCLEQENIVPELKLFDDLSSFHHQFKKLRHDDLVFIDMDSRKQNYQLSKELQSFIPSPILILFYTDHRQISSLLRLHPYRLIDRHRITGELGECLRSVITELPNVVHHPYVILESNHSLYKIPIGQIRYIESINKQLHVVTTREKLILRCQLSMVQELLEPYHFLKIHKSFLVNAHSIVRIDTSEILLEDGTQLPLSRYRQKEVIEQLREAFQWDTVV